MIYFYTALGFGGLAALIWVVRSLKSWGNLEAENQHLEEERDEALKLADRPRTMSDRVNRLRAWRDKLPDDSQ